MAVTRDYKSGKITEVYDADTGALREDGLSDDDVFNQRGAQLEFKAGDDVTFLVIGLPNGKRLVKEVGKKM